MGFHCLEQNGVQQEFGSDAKGSKKTAAQHSLELVHMFDWWCRKGSHFRLKLTVFFSEMKCHKVLL